MNKYLSNRKYWKNEETSFLKENFLKNGVDYCSKFLNRSKISIYHKTERLGIFVPRKQINMDKFINIDLPEVSYFLGLLWADGHVQTRHGVSLELINSDMLEIQSLIDSFGEWGKSNRLRKNSPNLQSGIKSHNRLFINFLLENDFESKSLKSPSKILNKIPSSLHHYFWRGFFDGDGCVSFHNNKKYARITFTGSFEQNWMDLELLLNNHKIKYSIYKTIGKNNDKSSALVITSKNNVEIIFNYLFKNKEKDNIGLNRKYKKYLDFKQNGSRGRVLHRHF